MERRCRRWRRARRKPVRPRRVPVAVPVTDRTRTSSHRRPSTAGRSHLTQSCSLLDRYRPELPRHAVSQLGPVLEHWAQLTDWVDCVFSFLPLDQCHQVLLSFRSSLCWSWRAICVRQPSKELGYSRFWLVTGTWFLIWFDFVGPPTQSGPVDGGAEDDDAGVGVGQRRRIGADAADALQDAARTLQGGQGFHRRLPRLSRPPLNADSAHFWDSGDSLQDALAWWGFQRASSRCFFLYAVDDSWDARDSFRPSRLFQGFSSRFFWGFDQSRGCTVFFYVPFFWNVHETSLEANEGNRQTDKKELREERAKKEKKKQTNKRMKWIQTNRIVDDWCCVFLLICAMLYVVFEFRVSVLPHSINKTVSPHSNGSSIVDCFFLFTASIKLPSLSELWRHFGFPVIGGQWEAPNRFRRWLKKLFLFTASIELPSLSELWRHFGCPVIGGQWEAPNRFRRWLNKLRPFDEVPSGIEWLICIRDRHILMGF